MKLIITGNLGYIGSVLTELAQQAGHEVVGIDTDFYRASSLSPVLVPAVQHYTDLRNLTELPKADAVIHLAALSNDPIGQLNPALTFDINHKQSVRLAAMAKAAGIERFLMTSTASVYGVASDKVDEQSKTDPKTAYAASKFEAEREIKTLADDNFTPVFLRPSTAFGISPRFRADIVLNNLSSTGFTTGELRVMSDGTPIRPVVSVKDIATTFLGCLQAPRALIHNEVFNVGRNDDNFSVRELVELVLQEMPECKVTYTGEHADNRSYFVLFDKLHSVLGDYVKFTSHAGEGVKGLLDGYRTWGLSKSDLEGGKYTRIKTLETQSRSGALSDTLFWKDQTA